MISKLKFRHHIEFVLLAAIAIIGLIANTDPTRGSKEPPALWGTIVVAVVLSAMSADLIFAVWKKVYRPNS